MQILVLLSMYDNVLIIRNVDVDYANNQRRKFERSSAAHNTLIVKVGLFFVWSSFRFRRGKIKIKFENCLTLQ